MKIYKLPHLADANQTNEYCLGPDLDTDSVYLLYGRLRPGEAARSVTTAEGAEEIICVVKGTVKVKAGNSVFTVTAGEAFISRKPQTFTLDNAGREEEAVYISAGARACSPEKKGTPSEKPSEPVGGKAQATQAAVTAEEASMSKAEDEADYIIIEDETLEEEAGEKS